ncbi:DUF1716-domain-containing protein [Punctularia strigosozonata HHB-11173 SS5]|uniref:DUF1716-domain-containing protein n=1 Tax=Punctularia strigosozonata (strain HHB-11173) TaxID=741275 RepID=UPI00044179FE|nr:DUF1716-domain-containing protein [Punctularia strigosozonata HHB-11173 SS5]EIN10361.1 DUF1716-domain-containing protein [Punctularia strigosozonata HHB-11173 SS5]
MDIDKLFKVPKLPTGGNKRRMPDAPTPEMLKKMRVEDEDEETSPTAKNGKAEKGKRRATVEDAEDEDVAMGEESDFAPGGDADYFAEEDEEGRFYGGGLTREQKEILNIFDQAGGEGALEDTAALTPTSIRKLLLRFQRAADKNQDQRSKWPDDPTKFIDSEADLDLAIKALLPLAQAPSVAYPELVESGVVSVLVGLLSHENPDIVIDVVEVIHELTDEDVGDEAEDDEVDEENKAAALKLLIESLQSQSILELLVDNLSRLKEEEESDKQGVFHILGIFENVMGFDPKYSNHLVSKTSILPWLLTRVQSKIHDENRGYAAELLAILLQNNRDNRLTITKHDGVETMLKVLSQYRRRDPVDADETEFMENIFDALCSALGEPEIKKLFLDSEGVDLMVLMMREKLQSRSRAIKVLDHAMAGWSGTSSCEVFVEAQGLKTLFSAFMGKAPKKQKNKEAATPASEDISHSLGIVASLFSNLASDSPARIRLLAKFVENNYEKVDKMLEIRDGASTRLKATDKEIETEKKALQEDGEEIGDEEDAWYLRRLDNGLFTLQTVDYCLAWVAMEDDGIRTHLEQMLRRKSKSLADIADTLKVYRDNVDEEVLPAPEEGEARPASQKEILEALVTFLEGTS